jgi:polyphosphate kinase
MGLLEDNSLCQPELFINRELSWVRFNARVLEEALDRTHPLLERVKFLAICGSNFDEFFMTRVSSLLEAIKKGIVQTLPDAMTSLEQIEATRREIIPLAQRHIECWKKDLLPALSREGIDIQKYTDLSEKERIASLDYFRQDILPRTKSRIRDLSHLSILNLRINLLVVSGDNSAQENLFVVNVPTDQFQRLIQIPPSRTGVSETKPPQEIRLVFLDDLIFQNICVLFPDMKNVKAYPFRVTRNAEIDILGDATTDFLMVMQKSVQARKSGFPCRLEVCDSMPEHLVEILADVLDLPEFLLYQSENPLGLVDLWELHRIDRQDLKDRLFAPCVPEQLRGNRSLFSEVRNRDYVIYHPYDGFEIIMNLLKQAVHDPDVLEICITLYRIDSNSPVIEALVEAVKKGKTVTALIELKAKFDEENNIVMTRVLQSAGVRVVYDFHDLKVHAKLCLIIKKEDGGIIRYSHIGSGNYNAATARIYGDIGYLTARDEIGKELEELFDLLAGKSKEEEFRHLLVAPRSLKHEILNRIEQEIACHKKTSDGYIAFKLNGLLDKDIIEALYRASMAGVKIDLNVRGLCSLRPGIKGLSDNISVASIVGRFLEHARIYYFRNSGQDEILLGSSDMMPRNLQRRIEVLLSVPDDNLKRSILENILRIHLRDNVKARKLLPSGLYERVVPGENEMRLNSQDWLIENRGIWNNLPPP